MNTINARQSSSALSQDKKSGRCNRVANKTTRIRLEGPKTRRVRSVIVSAEVIETIIICYRRLLHLLSWANAFRRRRPIFQAKFLPVPI